MEGIRRANLPPCELRDIAGKIANRMECVNAELGQLARQAILELSDRIDLEENGTCWNCAKLHNCGEYERFRKARMTCSYCANKEVRR